MYVFKTIIWKCITLKCFLLPKVKLGKFTFGANISDQTLP